MHAESPQNQQVSALVPGRGRSRGSSGEAGQDRPAGDREGSAGAAGADVTADGAVSSPVPADSGVPRPGRPGLAEPPDRPRPRESRGKPPPVSSELPKRTRDASRPSVSSRYAKRPVPAGGAQPAEPSSDPRSAEPSGPPQPEPPAQPEPAEPSAAGNKPSAAGSKPSGAGSKPSAAGKQEPSGQPEPAGQSSPPGQPEPSGEPRPPASQSWPPEPSDWSGEPAPAVVPRTREPSWGTVLITTLRLWTRRRLGRIRRLWPARARWRVLLVAALVAGVFVAGAATVRLSRAGGPGGEAGQQAGTPALAAAAAARQQAADWVARQAGADAIVACDPAMCAALQAHGVPAGRLLVLSPARGDPLGSDLVVATPAVRSQFGARLPGVYAPVTLAAFGSGAARIDVRAMAPLGAAAYRAQLITDVRARKAAGTLLLRNHRIHVAAAARAALASGEVDSRLLVTLAALAAIHPLDIAGFGPPGRGASPGVPLRSADVAGGPPHPASLPSLMTILRAQRSPYLPSSLKIVRIPARGSVLRIEYPAPSPLGLLGSGN
ncbi:MAG TPA: hypothetical protein VGJ54_14615 [Streptosporangiaceae bacterium]